MTEKTIIVWFRNDLRLTDHPALHKAVAIGARIVPLYIHRPEEVEPWSPGAASRVWLHHSLESLSDALRNRGNQLIIRQGNSLEILIDVIAQTGASAVYAHEQYEPVSRQRDEEIARTLAQVGNKLKLLNGNLLVAPGTIATESGSPYRVFTPYWKKFLSTVAVGRPEPAPHHIPRIDASINSESIDSLGLLPSQDWPLEILRYWQQGEDAAQKILVALEEELVADYPEQRDLPSIPGTTRLSPYLHFGELSPRQVAARLEQVRACSRESGVARGAETILRQLVWRDFAHHILVHFPNTTDNPMDKRFQAFPWQSDAESLRAWQYGRTGIPVVDAGMRELWHTGWMHNRVRMICASFLTKNLKIHWLEGARWFWDTLLDADLAQNTMNWQWVAGSGVDAAPYFRIFNPVTQGEKFDKQGDYVREWCPELANLPNKWVHRPWQAPQEVQDAANVSLGETYPLPVVDLAKTRAEALHAYKKHIAGAASTSAQRSVA